MADREKRAEEENTKGWISWEWKEFIVFKGLSFGKNKNLIRNSRHKL